MQIELVQITVYTAKNGRKYLMLKVITNYRLVLYKIERKQTVKF